MLFFNKNELRNKVQHFKMSLRNMWVRFSTSKEDLATQNMKTDLASSQSFPASDPPGFVSKSREDKQAH